MEPLKVAVVASFVALAAGCSKSGQENAQSTAAAPVVEKAAAPGSIKLENGLTYNIERVASFNAAHVPQNSDLRMADGDLAKYTAKACSLDVKAQYAPDRCDLYVQSDSAGTLIGYALVSHDGKGTRFQTVTTLNEQKQPGGGSCYLSGTIYDDATNDEKAVSDPSRDFSGRQMYGVSKNGAGEDFVSEVGPDGNPSDPDASLGVWYIKKEGDKLRINQERWNYCYKDAAATIDDVFYRAVSLVKAPLQ